ncbi:MAG: hypothetical protein A49_17510 [Methyloceanibacter sp.]|nr:MAG: hypothetical protein A49_17510 [Methyloceanibacter sp.]
MPQLNLDIDGGAQPELQIAPPPPVAQQAAPPAPQPPMLQVPPAPQDQPGQSSFVKKSPAAN